MTGSVGYTVAEAYTMADEFIATLQTDHAAAEAEEKAERERE